MQFYNRVKFSPAKLEDIILKTSTSINYIGRPQKHTDWSICKTNQFPAFEKEKKKTLIEKWIIPNPGTQRLSTKNGWHIWKCLFSSWEQWCFFLNIDCLLFKKSRSFKSQYMQKCGI